MTDTILFGNGINRVSEGAISWDELLREIKGKNQFSNESLPNTMVYERIVLERNASEDSQKIDELIVKDLIAKKMSLQESNEIFDALKLLDVKHYLTTNYDYAFEKAVGVEPEKLSTEDIYSLRRNRKYVIEGGAKYLWNIHGEIDHPKSIMLGLDHYCGSVSKIESYVKGSYKYSHNGRSKIVDPMIEKLDSSSFCFTSWVDLFFSSDVHIVGISLDYSEIDLWWLLNKRARFSVGGKVKNKIYFYTHEIKDEKKKLLESFKVNVVELDACGGDYKKIYLSAIKKMNIKSSSKGSEAALQSRSFEAA